MKKARYIISYTFSFAVLVTALVISARYMWNVFESAKQNYRTETVYLTRGDTMQNFYSASIPERPAQGMLVLNAVSLTQDGYRLAADKGVIVISAKAAATPGRSDMRLLSFRNIVSAAAKRYKISEDRIVVGDFSQGDTAYVRCAKSKKIFLAGYFTAGMQDSVARSPLDERALISWSASVLKGQR